jgi:hypothetical protein
MEDEAWSPGMASDDCLVDDVSESSQSSSVGPIRRAHSGSGSEGRRRRPYSAEERLQQRRLTNRRAAQKIRDRAHNEVGELEGRAQAMYSESTMLTATVGQLERDQASLLKGMHEIASQLLARARRDLQDSDSLGLVGQLEAMQTHWLSAAQRRLAHAKTVDEHLRSLSNTPSTAGPGASESATSKAKRTKKKSSEELDSVSLKSAALEIPLQWERCLILFLCLLLIDGCSQSRHSEHHQQQQEQKAQQRRNVLARQLSQQTARLLSLLSHSQSSTQFSSLAPDNPTPPSVLLLLSSPA